MGTYPGAWSAERLFGMLRRTPVRERSFRTSVCVTWNLSSDSELNVSRETYPCMITMSYSVL